MWYYDKYNEQKWKTIMSKVWDKLTISFSYSNCWISNHAMSFRILEKIIQLNEYF